MEITNFGGNGSYVVFMFERVSTVFVGGNGSHVVFMLEKESTGFVGQIVFWALCEIVSETSGWGEIEKVVGVESERVGDGGEKKPFLR